MRPIAGAALAAAMLLAAAAPAQTLRIGLREDPDVLDPTLARTYVGRIVFASLCDKLFDIDEQLRIGPQLATGHEWSADSKALTIRLRPGVSAKRRAVCCASASGSTGASRPIGSRAKRSATSPTAVATVGSPAAI